MPKDSVRNSQIPQWVSVMKTNHVLHTNGKWEFLGAFAKLLKAAVSLVMSIFLSVRPSAWNNSVPNGWIFMKFDYFSIICLEN